MDKYTAMEQAYKNGYAKGYEDGKAAVAHGRWVDANGIRNSKCDNCGVEFCRVMDGDCYYCPNCGAKMDGVASEQNQN